MASKRNRSRKLERDIAGEKFICPELAAKFIGCSRSTLNIMMARSKAGTLRPALVWYRDTPTSPIWFSKSFLEEWSRKRGGMHT